MKIDELQEDYDWREAFAYAAKPQPCAGDSASLDAVAIGDVTDIVAFSNGENDGEPWVGAFVPRDGRYLFLSAGCDYTGWDCQASGDAWVASDYETLYTFGMGADMRERLHLSERFDLAATRELRAATGCDDVMVFVVGDRVTVQIEAWYENCDRGDAVECVTARLRELGGGAT